VGRSRHPRSAHIPGLDLVIEETLEGDALTQGVHRPTFTLSFDTELIWGSFDQYSPAEFQRLYPDIRGTIRAALQLLEAYEVSATWAVVGHLFLRECPRAANGLAHPELVRPKQRWRPGDWYASDPCTDMERDPLWYGEDILDLIQGARVEQEIGCHSFSHVLYGDEELTSDAVNADLDACIVLAASRGITLRSFVFPRNNEGHHEALRRHGFTAYRGAEPTRWAGAPVPAVRAGHLLTHALGVAPPVSQPYEQLPGLWNIPASSLLMHRAGARRLISRAARLRRAREGIRRAEATRGNFHLWTHPFNLANDPPYLLGVLEAILKDVVAARDRGSMSIEPMGAVAKHMAKPPA
jgi:hypothetical protein